jgi:hypothetical protein
MNRVLVVLLSLMLASVIGFSSSFADEMCIPLGNIELSAPQGVEAKRSAVEFPHSAHFSINCQDCHHTWEYGDDDMSCMTSGCHDAEKAPKEGDKIAYYKEAYHKACIGCHKSMQKKNKELEMAKGSAEGERVKTGPTGCVACHPKE